MTSTPTIYVQDHHHHHHKARPPKSSQAALASSDYATLPRSSSRLSPAFKDAEQGSYFDATSTSNPSPAKDSEHRPRNVLRRKTSRSHHPPLDRSPSRTVHAPSPMPSGEPSSLTPAGAVAQAYKLQERSRSSSHTPPRVMSPATEEDGYDEEEKNAMPYYTVLGSTTGRVVAVGSAQDSNTWLPIPPPMERKTSSQQLRRKTSLKMLASGVKSVPATISKATVSGFVSPATSPGPVTTSFPPLSPQSGSNSPSPSTPSSSSGGGKLWRLMKRVSTGGLRDKYNQKPSDNGPPPPVPALPDFSAQTPQRRGHLSDTPRQDSQSARIPLKQKSSMHGMRSASDTGHDGPSNAGRPLRKPVPLVDSLSPESSSPRRTGMMSDQHLGERTFESERRVPSSSSSTRSGPSSSSRIPDEHQRPVTMKATTSSVPSSSSLSHTPQKRPSTISVPTRSSSATASSGTITTSSPGRQKHVQVSQTDDGHSSAPVRQQQQQQHERRRPATSSGHAGSPVWSGRTSFGSRPSTTSASVQSHTTSSPITSAGHNSSMTSIEESLHAKDPFSEVPVEKYIISPQERTRMVAQFDRGGGGNISEPETRENSTPSLSSPKRRKEREPSMVVQTHLPAPPRFRKCRGTRSDVEDNDEGRGHQTAQRFPPRSSSAAPRRTSADAPGATPPQPRPRRVLQDPISGLSDSEDGSRPSSPLIPEFSTKSAINTFGPRRPKPPTEDASASSLYPPDELGFGTFNARTSAFHQVESRGMNGDKLLLESSESELEFKHHSPRHKTSSSASLKKRPSLKNLLLSIPKNDAATTGTPQSSPGLRKSSRRPSTAAPTVSHFETVPPKPEITTRNQTPPPKTETSASSSPASSSTNPPARPARSAARPPPPSPGQSPASTHPPHAHGSTSSLPSTASQKEASTSSLPALEVPAASGRTVSDAGYTPSPFNPSSGSSPAPRLRHARSRTELVSQPRPRSNSLGADLPMPNWNPNSTSSSLHTNGHSSRKRPSTASTPQKYSASKSFDASVRPKLLPPSNGNSRGPFRLLGSKSKTKLTEDEKDRKWNDLLQRSDAAGGTLHLWAGRDKLGEVEDGEAVEAS